MKRVLYAAMVFVSAFFLVSAGMKENEALGIIPNYSSK